VSLTRTNVTLPTELLREIDALAGPRGRSRFLAEAGAARLKREKLRVAIEQAAGSVPSWRRLSREDVSRLVEDLRSEETD